MTGPATTQECTLILRDLMAVDGLARVDLERFWVDQDQAYADPFGEANQQMPLGVLMAGEAMFDELGVQEDMWRYLNDIEWRLSLSKAYNDKAETIVGRRLLPETISDPSLQYPPVKGLHDVFEAQRKWVSGSWWLEQAANNEDELCSLLDRVESRDIRTFILPDNWEQEKARLLPLGIKPSLYRGQRGPVTFAMSVYGVENTIFLIHDNPALAERFRDAILATMLGIAGVLDEEAGYTPGTAPHGFGFADDNCAMLTPGMYECFAYPILKAIWDHYSPDPGDQRYMHADSDMAHLLPILGTLGLDGTNFGPNVTISEIRQHLPRAVIAGQLAPFTLSRNDELGMVAEFMRDFEMSQPARGVAFATAGSINNGSRLSGMRLIMSLIQHHGRYVP